MRVALENLTASPPLRLVIRPDTDLEQRAGFYRWKIGSSRFGICSTISAMAVA